MPVPAIAIHGSGEGPKIAKAVDGNFKEASLYDRVVTLAFDWDGVVPQPSHKGPRNLYRFLRRQASIIAAAARAGLEFGYHTLDRSLGALQLRVHQVLQWLLAALVAMLVAVPVAAFVVALPAAQLGLPTSTLSLLRWAGTGVTWLQVALGAGVTLIIFLAGLRVLLTGSARPVVIAFRGIVLLLLQPLLVIFLAALVADWWLMLAVLVLLALSSYVSGGASAAVLWGVVLVALLALRLRWARGRLRGPPKVALDACRYLGEPQFRDRIQRALDKAVALARSRVGNEQDFVLAGQGMGTVMALDSLLHSRVWRESDRVLLVTMGSPLRRWFLTFYPATLFPESMEGLVESIARRVAEIRWVNVHRPWDYLGAQLGLKKFKGKDISTGIGVRRVVGHADYWRDADARLTFQHGLVKLRKLEPVFVARKESVHQVPKPRGAVALRLPPLMHSLLRGVAVLGILGWMLWWVATGSGVLSLAAEAPSELLERRGFTVEAAATHRREAVDRLRGVSYVDHWEFAFADSSGVRRSVSVERDVSDGYLGLVSHGFDARALTRQIRAACAGTWPPPWLPVGDMQTPCTLEGVRLRYYSGDLTVFNLPDFPQHRFGAAPLLDWTEVGVIAVVLTVLALAPVVLGVRVFGVFVG